MSSEINQESARLFENFEFEIEVDKYEKKEFAITRLRKNIFLRAKENEVFKALISKLFVQLENQQEKFEHLQLDIKKFKNKVSEETGIEFGPQASNSSQMKSGGPHKVA